MKNKGQMSKPIILYVDDEKIILSPVII